MAFETSVSFCSHHWELLRLEIKKQGLESFVAKSGKECVERIKNGKPDPLMGACTAITTAFINDCVESNIKPMGCPICGVIKNKVPEMNWIVGAVQDELEKLSIEV